MKKQILIYASIIFGAIVLTSIAVSFAYYQGIKQEGNVQNYSVDFENYNFITSGSKEVNLEISDLDMYNYGTTENTVVASDESQITITLENNDTKKITCSYSLVWDWSQSPKSYSPSVAGAMEFTVTGNDFTEKNLGYDSGKNYFTLINYTLEATAGNTASVIKTVTTKFYNLGAVDQSSLIGNYIGIIKVINENCTRS